MAFPAVTDIVATTIENRSKTIADNVTNNNALLAYIKAKGNIKTISGGSEILEELSFAENANAGWYSGYDLLPVAAQDVISAARFNIKQAAVPVTISGLEELQNSGKEQMIDLLEARMNVAEATMDNMIANGIYGDGTAAGGKEIIGLDAAIPVDTATGRVDNGVYGSIDRATWAFWRPYFMTAGTAYDKDTLLTAFNTMWASLVRGRDQPDLIVVDSHIWGLYMAGLQAQQRFTAPSSADRGFSTVKFFNTDVVLDGGLYFPSSAYGPGAPPKTAFFINTKYLKWRPHADRNMVPLNPNRRYAINQDAHVSILGWAGALTSSGQAFHGRLVSL